MLDHRVVRPLILTLFAALLASTTAFGQQKYRLHAPLSVGDTCLVDSTMDISYMTTVNVAGGGQGDQQIPGSYRQREAFRETVLAVDSKGPSVVRRTYSILRAVTTDAFLKETTKTSPLQGKTVTMRRAGSQVTVTAGSGKLSKYDEANLVSAMIQEEGVYFPDRDLSPGDEWPIDPAVMFAQFPGVQKADARFGFQQVVSHAGHPCAQIHVTLELHGTQPGSDIPMTFKLAGSLYRALDLKRTLAEEETGPLTIEGDQQVNGMSVHLSGQGTMHVQETHHWLKVDGKPLTVTGHGGTAGLGR